MGGLAKPALTAGIAFALGVVATLVVAPGATPARSDRRAEPATVPPCEVTRLEQELADARAQNEKLRAALVAETPPAPATLDALAWLQRRLPQKFDTLTVAQLRHLRELDLSGMRVTAQDLA
ncbi:MAG: hypothetical protein ACYSUM_19565, partial [Planctomycetota bacterium]